MENKLSSTIILIGILVCLIIIAIHTKTDDNQQVMQSSTPYLEVSNDGGRIVQIAPNRIGVVDLGEFSGWEQLVVFEYVPETKEFVVVSSLPYDEYFYQPEKYGIPVKSNEQLTR